MIPAVVSMLLTLAYSAEPGPKSEAESFSISGSAFCSGRIEAPIVAVTANAFAEDIEACMAAGMQRHLAKPLQLARLSEALAVFAPSAAPPNQRRQSQTPRAA